MPKGEFKEDILTLRELAISLMANLFGAYNETKKGVVFKDYTITQIADIMGYSTSHISRLLKNPELKEARRHKAEAIKSIIVRLVILNQREGKKQVVKSQSENPAQGKHDWRLYGLAFGVTLLVLIAGWLSAFESLASETAYAAIITLILITLINIGFTYYSTRSKVNIQPVRKSPVQPVGDRPMSKKEFNAIFERHLKFLNYLAASEVLIFYADWKAGNYREDEFHYQWIRTRDRIAKKVLESREEFYRLGITAPNGANIRELMEEAYDLKGQMKINFERNESVIRGKKLGYREIVEKVAFESRSIQDTGLQKLMKLWDESMEEYQKRMS